MRATCIASVEAPETRRAGAEVLEERAADRERVDAGMPEAPEAAVLDRDGRRRDPRRDLVEAPEAEPLVAALRQLAEEAAGAVAHEQRRLGGHPSRAGDGHRGERRHRQRERDQGAPSAPRAGERGAQTSESGAERLHGGCIPSPRAPLGKPRPRFPTRPEGARAPDRRKTLQGSTQEARA